MEFMIGALGAMFIICTAAGGGAFGWWVRGKVEQAKRRTDVAELTEDEMRKKKAEELAMAAVMSYSADTAYGTDPKPRGDRG